MATTPYAAQRYRADQAFFVRMTIFIALLIAFGFLQFALRGMVDYRKVPVWVHLHGMIMVSWLGLAIVQNRLAASGDLVSHRKIGWIGAVLVAGIVCLASFTGIMALKRGTEPPFFSEAYFLALTQVDAVVFGGLVFAAIARRKDTESHRRLMIGAMVLITEPAFGRLLPMPFMNGMGEWAVLLLQLTILSVLAAHDRRVLGRIHPATLTAGAIIALSHVLIELAAISPLLQLTAARIAG